jgi:hypothetical protein
MCPVCTVTVIAGLGLSRLLGIDDLVTSIWIGGFVLSFSFITINWINKKWPKWKFGFNIWWKVTIIANMYLLALLPLAKTPTILRILYGTAVGSVAFLLGAYADKFQRKKYKKIFFPFQKVIFPILALLIASLVFFFITR